MPQEFREVPWQGRHGLPGRGSRDSHIIFMPPLGDREDITGVTECNGQHATQLIRCHWLLVVEYATPLRCCHYI